MKLLCEGFAQSENDYSLFVKKCDDLICIAAIYVDDVILTGNDTQSFGQFIYVDDVILTGNYS